MRDQAVADVDDLVRAVGAQSRDPVAPDRELHPGTPAKPRRGGAWGACLVARQGLHDDLAVDTRQPAQALPDDGGLERALRGQCRVLPVQPPQPPGRAFGHGAGTWSGEGMRISTASARANRVVTSVTRATTRSPGSACLTKTTGSPSGLATHQPPCATSPTATSKAWPT